MGAAELRSKRKGDGEQPSFSHRCENEEMGETREIRRVTVHGRDGRYC